MSDEIVRGILSGWRRPLDTAAKKQAGVDLHEDDAPLWYTVGDQHVVVARAPWMQPVEHAAAVGATAAEAANNLLAAHPSPAMENVDDADDLAGDAIPAADGDVPDGADVEGGASEAADQRTDGDGSSYSAGTLIDQRRNLLSGAVNAFRDEWVAARIPPGRESELRLRIIAYYNSDPGVSLEAMVEAQREDDYGRAWTARVSDHATALQERIRSEPVDQLHNFEDVASLDWPSWGG